MKKQIKKISTGLHIIVYLYLVFVWFKDNFVFSRDLKLSYHIPLIIFILLSLFKIFLLFTEKKPRPHIKFNKSLLALVIVITAVIAIRIPYIIHSYGITNSDDGVAALMGKHISEGKVPPVTLYGQFHVGSSTAHYYALLFKIFGYSIPLLKLSAVLLFLGFVVVQFILIRKIFNPSYAFIIGLFYALPVGHVIAVSFENAPGNPAVLFLGSLIIYISFLISGQNKHHLIPLLGFLLGFSFWTHQISIHFILLSVILVIFNFRFELRKYLVLFLYASIGSFPLILNEVFYNFTLLRYLLKGGPGGILSWAKLENAIKGVLGLFTFKLTPFNYLYFIPILAGVGISFYFVYKKKKFEAQNIHALFFVLFLVVFTLSRFSARDVLTMRYLYPLYFSLPIVLTLPFYLIKRKLKYIFMGSLFLGLFILSNARGSWMSFSLLRDAHHNMKKTINVMEKTNKKYWFGEYWSAVVITALTGERITVFPYIINIYYPYELYYYNNREDNRHNLIFLKEKGIYALRYKEEIGPINEEWLAEKYESVHNFLELLDRLKARAKIEKINDNVLIYDIEGAVSSYSLDVPVPEKIPSLKLEKIDCSRGLLHLFFKLNTAPKEREFKIHVKILGYSSNTRNLLPYSDEIRVSLPFPNKKNFEITYYIDYAGLKIDSTLQSLSYSLTEEKLKERKRPLLFISGISPPKIVKEEKFLLCDKEVQFHINRNLPKRGSLSIHLFSPFNFSPLYWYEKFSQSVSIYVNGHFLREEELIFGKNIIEIPLSNSSILRNKNVIDLKFRYILSFSFAPSWSTSALLEKIVLSTPL